MTPIRKPPPPGTKACICLDMWAEGWTTPFIAAAVGWKKATVRRLLMGYRKQGEPRAMIKRPTGRLKNGTCRHPAIS